MNTSAGAASVRRSSWRRRAHLITVLVLVALGLPAVAMTTAEAAVSGDLRRYPYLTDLVGSVVTVNWSTLRTATAGSVVSWEAGSTGCGTTPPSGAKSTTATRIAITVNGVAQYQWRATVTGLTPDTSYCYRTRLGTTDLLASDPTPSFLSQRASDSTAPFSFAVFGDWGQVDSAGQNIHQENVLGRIASSGARFAVTTGDQPYGNGSQTNYGDLVYGQSAVFGPRFWAVPGRSIPLFPSLGNHGLTSAFLQNWPQPNAVSSSAGRYQMDTYCCLNGTSSVNYPSAWYAFDSGNVRFYVLDAAWASSNLGSGTPYANDYAYHWDPQSSAEYAWLKDDLADNQGKLKFAFLHYPIHSANRTETSDTFLQGAGPERLEGLLGANGVAIAFSGHAHNYSRATKRNGLINYVTGGGGARLQPADACAAPIAAALGWSYSANAGSSCGSLPKPGSQAAVHHFLLVTVDGSNVTVTPTDSLGRTFDAQTYTFTGGADTSAPSAPTLSAVSVSSSQVDLSWTASTDDVGVTGYEVLRDGAVIATVGTVTSYSDTTVAAGTTYTYRVRARDAAGNVSEPSNTETVTTAGSAGQQTVVFPAAADARVLQASPTTNYGTSTTLTADSSTTAQEESYLTFDVSGLAEGRTVTSAKLRLTTTGTSSSASTDGPEIYAVADTSWAETGITWNTKPARATTPSADVGALTANQTVEYDVTALVTGNGAVSFGVIPDSTDGAIFHSGESTTTSARPQLVVTSS